MINIQVLELPRKTVEDEIPFVLLCTSDTELAEEAAQRLGEGLKNSTGARGVVITDQTWFIGEPLPSKYLTGMEPPSDEEGQQAKKRLVDAGIIPPDWRDDEENH